jgi:hypothetical protein
MHENSNVHRTYNTGVLTVILRLVTLFSLVGGYHYRGHMLAPSSELSSHVPHTMESFSQKGSME